MAGKISDLTVDEFKLLIASTVNDSMQDFLEDLEALRSPAFIQSVAEAREDYKTGNVKSMEQVFGAP